MFVSRYPWSRRRIVTASFYNPACSDPVTFCHGGQLLRKLQPPFRTVIKYAWPCLPWCSRGILLALSRFNVTVHYALSRFDVTVRSALSRFDVIVRSALSRFDVTVHCAMNQ